MQRLNPAKAAVVSIATALSMGVAAPAMAQSTEPATVTEVPEYFISEVVSAATAERIANFCPTLSVNPLTGRDRSAVVFERLLADGIDPQTFPQGTGATEIQEQTAAFVEKHGLQEPTVETICEAGRAEIAEGTVVGLYLVEVQE